MTTDPTRWTDDEAGANAVLFVAGEFEPVDRGGFEARLRDDALMASLVADLRGVDAALRGTAEAESPSVHELRRTRESSIRLVRTQGVALVAAAAARRPARRTIPRWSLVAAAAVLAVVGVVGWLSSVGPVSLPAKPLGTDVAQRDPREQWRDDLRDYGELVPAFINPADIRPADDIAAMPDSLDDGDVQVDALNVLSTASIVPDTASQD